MIIIQEDVDFVIHYGVKGQQWGVRKTKDQQTQKSGLSSGTKKALVIGGTAAVVIGAAFAAKVISEKGWMKMHSINMGDHEMRVFNMFGKVNYNNI